MKFLLRSLLLCLFAANLSAQEISPLPKAHAHNDYEHDRPLLDALEQGFCSVEADVFAIDGELRVAHNRIQTKAGRTLEKLYLDPLLARAKKNGGRIYPNGPMFTLLIDFKTKAEPTYALLKPLLEKYPELLVAKKASKADKQPNQPAMKIVISGNRPFDLVKKEDKPLCGLDGRLSDLESKLPATVMPMISDNWRNHFKWRGNGDIPAAERTKLHEAVKKAHAAKRTIRFWATPENEAVWKELRDAGADHINTDQLARLRKFLTKDKSQ